MFADKRRHKMLVDDFELQIEKLNKKMNQRSQQFKTENHSRDRRDDSNSYEELPSKSNHHKIDNRDRKRRGYNQDLEE